MSDRQQTWVPTSRLDSRASCARQPSLPPNVGKPPIPSQARGPVPSQLLGIGLPSDSWWTGQLTGSGRLLKSLPIFIGLLSPEPRAQAVKNPHQQGEILLPGGDGGPRPLVPRGASVLTKGHWGPGLHLHDFFALGVACVHLTGLSSGAAV